MRVGANVGLKPLMNGAKRGRYCARFCEDECCQFLLAKIEQKAKLPFPEKAGRNANMSGTRNICISITATPTEIPRREKNLRIFRAEVKATRITPPCGEIRGELSECSAD